MSRVVGQEVAWTIEANVSGEEKKKKGWVTQKGGVCNDTGE